MKHDFINHNYGYSKRAAMYHFFTYHLGLNTKSIEWTPIVIEDFATILPDEELRDYTKQAQCLIYRHQ